MVLDSDLGVSRGHQSDEEDDEEEVKDYKDDNEEAQEDDKAEDDVLQKNQIQNSQLWSLIETCGFSEDISLMMKTKMRMMRRRSRMTMRRPRRTTI